MLTNVHGSDSFQVLTSSFSISPSEQGYVLNISANGKDFSPLFTVGAGVTRLVTGMASGSYYKLVGNESDVIVNWVRSCVTPGGSGGAGNELTPVSEFPLGAEAGTVVAYSGSSSAAGVYQYDGSEWTLVGGDDSKTIVDFDHTTQAERASIYAELKALYDAGSGATINRNYDFYKTVNTWQGLKIDYYSFSADTLVFGKVVSPENLTDQVVYEQVMTIDDAGNVAVVTNTVGGGGDMSGYYTSAQTDEKIASAVTPVANRLEEVEQVTASALTELRGDILEISGSSVDLSAYYTSAQTEDAISAATSGKADAASVRARNSDIPLDGPVYIPKWNEEGIITGDGTDVYMQPFYVNGVASAKIYKHQRLTIPPIYAPVSAGTAGDILVSSGPGNAPVWSAMPAGDVTKAYVDSADTALQDQIDTMDEVVSAALVDLEGKKVESQDVKHMVKLTQAQYDQLATKDPYTFYIIVSN